MKERLSFFNLGRHEERTVSLVGMIPRVKRFSVISNKNSFSDALSIGEKGFVRQGVHPTTYGG